MVAVTAIFVSYVLVTTVYYIDVGRSVLTLVKAPVDPFVTDLGTMLAEEGRHAISRPPEETPFYRFRWAHVFDLDGGFTMHIRVNKVGLSVFLGPVVKDNREAVGRLVELVKRAGSKDDAATLS